MRYRRLAYDDQDSASQMYQDCRACGSSIDLVPGRIDPSALTLSAPSLAFDQFPRDVLKAQIEVSEAAAHLASRLHLHLS